MASRFPLYTFYRTSSPLGPLPKKEHRRKVQAGVGKPGKECLKSSAARFPLFLTSLNSVIQVSLQESFRQLEICAIRTLGTWCFWSLSTFYRSITLFSLTQNIWLLLFGESHSIGGYVLYTTGVSFEWSDISSERHGLAPEKDCRSMDVHTDFLPCL